MYRLILATLFLVFLAACAGNTASTSTPRSTAAVYSCPDGSRFIARNPGPELAVVEWMGRAYELTRVESASGARFQGQDIDFWDRGGEATLSIADEEHAGCVATPASSRAEEARLLGVDLFATGQEPGWLLGIREGRWLRFEGDYGATIVTTAAPVMIADGNRRVTYMASSEGRTIIVEVRPAECLDSMSGEPFSHTVSVQYGDREFSGCGRVASNP